MQAMHSHLGRILACRMNRTRGKSKRANRPIGHKLAKPGDSPLAFRSRSKGDTRHPLEHDMGPFWHDEHGRHGLGEGFGNLACCCHAAAARIWPSCLQQLSCIDVIGASGHRVNPLVSLPLLFRPKPPPEIDGLVSR